ncbi:MAG: calcium/sodium antiporter [Candidatus Omnitrophota bacterium]|nr:calcium/sodium antiporter [Candidatus Omnitrophota bacterium]MDZ4241426.1 calcium/sodium antiporter [Candidatus Omnitrophota bacterium]
MIIDILFLILGFGLLIKGADLLVEGASSLARLMKVSDLVVGLTVVAFGTSMPEMFVNVFASFTGHSELAIGNVVGSNLFNILVILGISAVVYPLQVTKNTTWKEIPLAFLAAVLVLVLANDQWIDGAETSSLSRIDGIVFLSFFVIFLYYVFVVAQDYESLAEGHEPVRFGMAKSFAFIALGLVGLVVGGKWIVDSAIHMATAWGVSESLIGITIVGVGTSLPELVTSLVAARRKNTDIAIGNVVGSNIFNVFLILGVSAVIRPLPFAPKNNFDIGIMIAATALLFAAMFTGKKRLLDRWEGMAFVACYVIYVIVLINRG